MARVRPPVYLVEPLTEESWQAMFERWIMVGEGFRLPYDARVRV